MDYKLKNRDGVETTYTKEKIKIPAATGDSMVVFTQGEAQAEKAVDINANGAFIVEPDTGYSFVKKVSGTVNVPASEPVLQEKSVSIVSNGQTSVSPDDGKDGLSKVDITVNVPVPDLSQVTATAADVLEGKKILGAGGRVITGTIPIIPKGDIISYDGVLYFPEGYYIAGNYVPPNSYTLQTFGYSPDNLTQLVINTEYAKRLYGVPMYGAAVTTEKMDVFCFCSAYCKSNGADSHLYITGSANIDGNKVQIDIDIGIDYSNPDLPVAKGMTVNSATAYGGSVDISNLITTDTIVFMTWTPVTD